MYVGDVMYFSHGGKTVLIKMEDTKKEIDISAKDNKIYNLYTSCNRLSSLFIFFHFFLAMAIESSHFILSNSHGWLLISQLPTPNKTYTFEKKKTKI